MRFECAQPRRILQTRARFYRRKENRAVSVRTSASESGTSSARVGKPIVPENPIDIAIIYLEVRKLPATTVRLKEELFAMEERQ